MNRRELFLGAGALALAGVSGAASAQEGHHHHAKSGGEYDKLIYEAVECIKKGELCLNHCFETFASGDTSLAECARTVNEMIYICEATVKAASYNSRHAKEVIAVCIKYCEDCEKECRKHEKKHQICKESAENCAKCIKEAKKVLKQA